MKSFALGARWGNCKSAASQVMLFADVERNKSELCLSSLAREEANRWLGLCMIDVRGYNCHRVLHISG
jgi:hypothetical protein